MTFQPRMTRGTPATPGSFLRAPGLRNRPLRLPRTLDDWSDEDDRCEIPLSHRILVALVGGGAPVIVTYLLSKLDPKAFVAEEEPCTDDE